MARAYWPVVSEPPNQRENWDPRAPRLPNEALVSQQCLRSSNACFVIPSGGAASEATVGFALGTMLPSIIDQSDWSLVSTSAASAATPKICVSASCGLYDFRRLERRRSWM